MAPSPDAILALLAMALPLMGSPGPAIVALTASGAAFGVRASLPFLFGILLGIFCVLGMTASGVTGLLLAVPGLGPVLVGAAVLYMLYLAYRIATAPVPGIAEATDSSVPGFGAGLVLAFTNVKAYTMFSALYASHTLIEGAPVADTAFKYAILTCIMMSVNTLWLIFGGVFAGLIRTPRIGRAFNVTMAVFLLLSVALAAVPLDVSD